MRFCVLLVTCCLLAVACEVGGEHLDIDFNRLRVVPETSSRYTQEASNARRRSIETASDAHDDHNSGGVHAGPRTTFQRRPNGLEISSDEQRGGKVYEPREDPRQFYQSQAYLRATLEKDDAVSRQMSGVFPEMVTRLFTSHNRQHPKAPELRNLDRRSRYREWNSVTEYDEDICVKCPAERTLIARPGVDKVLLQAPPLKACSGDKPPRGVRFFRSYGPMFGSLLGAGSHVIVGKVVYKGQHLQDCRFHVHVVTQLCPTPHHLTSRCGPAGCNFTCSNHKLELLGSSSLTCGADLRWSGPLPVCRVRSWCHPPPPPDNGELSCQSAQTADGLGILEGSRCRARCTLGWRASPRGAAVCRRGMWTHALSCKRRPDRQRRERGHR